MERTRTGKKEVTFNILTNDPSITGWGWAIVTIHGEVLDSGCIKTQTDNTKKNLRKTDDRIRRVSEINQTILYKIRQYNVRYILAEAPHGSQSAVAAIMIGMVAGMAQTMSDALDIPIEWYSEGEVKKQLLNKRAAAKSEMIDAIKEEMKWRPTGTKYIDEAVADALGVFLTACVKSETLRLVRKGF